MSELDAIIKVLCLSQRPLILMGAGARDAKEEIIAFVERWQIPIETTWNAIDTIEWKHPLFIGRPGVVATRAANFAIQECDFLLSIGARLDVSTIAFEYDRFAPGAVKVLVDIDPGEGHKLSKLDWFVNIDALKFIRDISSKTEAYSFGTPKWLKQCQLWKATYGVEGKTMTYQFMQALEEAMNDEALVMSTAGNAGGSIFPAFFKQKKQRVILTSCGLGSMGGGIATSIGVASASGKKVICVEGDGSFCQNMQELEVVRRLNLPITFFVICNNGYASIKQSQDRAFGRHLDNMSFPAIWSIAEAFDIPTRVLTDFGGLDHIIGHNYPEIVEIFAPEDEAPFPRIMFDGRGDMGLMWPYLEDKELR